LYTLEEGSCQLGFFFSFDPKVDDGTSGVEGFDDFVFVVAGEDEAAVTSKLLNKRP
jgi:hypothetical protein